MGKDGEGGFNTNITMNSEGRDDLFLIKQEVFVVCYPTISFHLWL